MLDKMFGVSPPLKGEAPDSKLADSKDLRGSSKSDYKKDFERALDKKLEKPEKKTDDPVERKQTQKSTELRADKKDKKSLGGNKKKVTEDDDKMVSNVMASTESKVEIPDSKIENPAEIEIDIPEKLKTGVETEVKAASQIQSGLIQNLIGEPKVAAIDAPTNAATVVAQSVQPMTLELPQDALPLPKQGSMDELLNQPQPETQVPAVANGKVETINVEAELGAAVGFNPDEAMKQTSGELLQKMRTFDADKKPASEKSQTFEQSILSRLQNEQVKTVSQSSAQNSAGESRGESQQEGSGLKEAKPDQLDASQTNLAAGQSHSDFKSQLGLAPLAKNNTLTAKLEEHREANINEIMNKAQYLVTKGGGEVTVKMSPEGLGELQLKVIFQDGKLNVEMQTQNKDIKKLVEESLTELKSGLAAHRLSLEHVKINTVDATNADNNTQFQSNLNQRGSQDHAREQWREFQGSLNSQSDGKPSQADSRNQPGVAQRGASVNTATAVTAMRTYGGTKGATINRVA